MNKRAWGKILQFGIILIGILIFSAFSKAQIVKKFGPDAVNGVMNLKNWNFLNDGNIKLDGEWEFYWEELLTPEDFSKEKLIRKPEYVQIPFL